METIARQPRPLGTTGQQPRRNLENQTRRRALALCRWAAPAGVSHRSVAARIGLAHQTVSDWQHSHGRDHPADRGHPSYLLDAEKRELVEELLAECRGQLGLPSLKQRFHDIPRSVLAELRGHYLDEHDVPWNQLTWTHPGSVWAADFTEPEWPIDGNYRYVLSVRDLASSYQLLSLPVRHADADATALTLRYLFTVHGAPLVLKSDNGSHFIADEIIAMLLQNNVIPLFSPPMTPRYNGGIEAGNGSVKLRTLLTAGAHGRADCWTFDDLEAARCQANDQARPWGRNGPSPEDRWNTRASISEDQRRAFLAALVLATHDEVLKMIEQTHTRPGWRPAGCLNACQRATVARRAVRRVLVDLGFLFVRRTAN